MKLSAALMLVSALILAACTRPAVRETIIERPVVAKETVVERPVVVEKPVVVERPVIAAAPLRSCTYGATTYSHGSTACQLRYQYRCSDGAWDSTNFPC